MLVRAGGPAPPWQGTHYLPPSGDTSGATDIAAINAALAAYAEVWLQGSYTINAPISPGSNCTLVLADATIKLANGSNCNMVLNADYLGSSGGNQNIRIRGIGRALFDQNQANQVYSTAQTAPAASWQGHTIILSHVQTFEVANLQFQNAAYYAISPQQVSDGWIHDIYVSSGGSTYNAAVQTMGGVSHLVIERISGTTEDDTVALSTGDIYTAYYADQTHTLASAGNVSDVTIRDIDTTHVTANSDVHLVAMFTGYGNTMKRIVVDRCHVRYPTQSKGRMMIGCDLYFAAGHTAAPADLSDITINNTNCPVNFAGSASQVAISNITFPTGVNMVQSLFELHSDAAGITLNDISISNVTYNGPAAPTQFVLDLGLSNAFGSSTYVQGLVVNRLTLSNITIAGGGVGAFIKNGYGVVTDLFVNGVSAAAFPNGLISAANGLFSGGYIDNVKVKTPTVGQNWSFASPTVVFGANCPIWTSSDPPPTAVRGSIVSCDQTRVLDGGSAVPATYVSPSDGVWTRLASGVVPAAAFVSDTFAGVTGTLLTAAHSGQVTGATWVKHPNFAAAAAPVISNLNLLRCNDVTNVEICYPSGAPGSADYTVQSTITFVTIPGSAMAGVGGRLDATLTTYYSLRYNAGIARWEFLRCVSGTYTTLAQILQTPAVGQVFVVGLKMVGTTISALLNGVVVAQVTDANIAGAGHPCLIFYNNGATPSDATGFQLSNFTAA